MVRNAVVVRWLVALAVTTAAWTAGSASPAFAANTAPTCSGNASLGAVKDAPVFVYVACSDDGQPAAPLRLVVVDQPQHGAITPGESYSGFSYRPQAGYTGPDSFTVKATDGELESNVATMGVTVNEPSAPVCTNPSTPVTWPVRANGMRSILLPLFCTIGPSGLPWSAQITTEPEHGTVTVRNALAFYAPDDDYVGTDRFGFRLVNEKGQSAEVIVGVDVGHGGGWKPQCSGGPPTVRTGESRTLTLSCVDEDLEPSEIAIVDPPQHGTLSALTSTPFHPVAGNLMPSIASSGATATYTPEPGYTGPDSFSFRSDDGNHTSDLRTVTIDVVAADHNTAPSCNASAPWIAKDTSAFVRGGCTDADGDAITGVTIVQPPQHGTVSDLEPAPGASFQYTPDAGFTGVDLVRLRGTDSRGATSTVATVPIHVVDGDVPLAKALYCPIAMLAVKRNQALTTPAIACDAARNPALEVVEQPQHGQAAITDGKLVFTPEANYVGSDQLTLRATGNGRTTAFVVYVQVRHDAKVKVLSGPPASTGDRSATFEVYAQPGVTATCALSNSAGATPTACSGSKSYEHLTVGEHVLTLTGTDAQNRVSRDTYRFVVTDNAAPTVSLTQPAGGSSSTDPTPTFAGTAGDAPGDLPAVTVRVWKGARGGAPQQTLAVDAAGDGSYSVTSAGLEPGTYVAVASQADDAGNVGESGAVTFTILAPASGGSAGGSGSGGGAGGPGPVAPSDTPGTGTPPSTPSADAGPPPTVIGGGDPPEPQPLPRRGEVAAALTGSLERWSDSPPRIGALLREGSAELSFDAPSAGTMTIRWYVEVPRRNGKATRRVLVGEGRVRADGPGPLDVTVELTEAGRKLLDGRRSVQVTATASFRPQAGRQVERSAKLTLRSRKGK